MVATVAATGVVVSLPAQKPADFASSAPPADVFLGISENTGVNYIGPVPSPIVGAVDVDDSTYNRLIGVCGPLSGVGTAVAYDTITITNNYTGPANFVVSTSAVGDTTSCIAGGDTYLFAYTPTFSPASPATNCVTGDDDGGIGLCSNITFPMNAGQTMVVVVTSFANGNLFPYQVNFDGTDNFPAVPFSGPVWLIILALALSAMGIWAVRRRAAGFREAGLA